MKTTYQYVSESEIISGEKDPVRAMQGLGDGFNSHAGTGTIASATEQRRQADRGEAAFLRTVNTSADVQASVKTALHMAVITETLKTFDVKATWKVSTPSGVEVVDPRNAVDTLTSFGSSLKVELSTSLAAEDVVDLVGSVHAKCAELLKNIDNLDGAYANQGREFFALMAASSIWAMSVGSKGSALTVLVDAAKEAVAQAQLVSTGSIFAIDASDLEVCPTCRAATGRTDLVCVNGHKTAAAIRAEQESIVLDAAVLAAREAGLDLAVSAKVKGLPRFELSATTDATTLVSLQDVSAKVSFGSDLQPGDLTAAWSALAATTHMRTVLESTLIPSTAGAEVRSRVLRSVSDAIDKAADKAADVIADPLRTEIAHFIVGIERDRAAAAWQKVEVEYRKQLVAAANRPPKRMLEEFVATTNKHRRFVSAKNGAKRPNGRKAQSSKGRTNGAKRRSR